MKKIYKYTLKPVDDQLIEIPTGAQILTVQSQDNKARLWVLADPKLPVENRHIRLSRTGDELMDNSAYISTFQIGDGAFVFHAFEIINKYRRI